VHENQQSTLICHCYVSVIRYGSGCRSYRLDQCWQLPVGASPTHSFTVSVAKAAVNTERSNRVQLSAIFQLMMQSLTGHL